MTLERIITHSKEINETCFRFFLDYPMGSYIPKWKVFRAFTDENSTIAEHVVSTRLWQETNVSSVLDIGTGDGLVLSNLLFRSNKSVNKVVLVDPNSDLLTEAIKQIKQNNDIHDIEVYNDDINCLLPSVFQEIDFLLLIHVLYLIPSNNFERLISNLPPGLPAIIITDNKNSLFPKCWEITAPKYFKRSQYITSFLSQLSQDEFSVKSTVFKTFLKNPFLIQQPEVKDSLLSLICYTDYESLDAERKLGIFNKIKQHSVEDLIYCDSICYEIMRVVHK